MTDGLRALAGDGMRAGLVRFTSSPLSGAITGATSTAILQSSSATTVAAVGFVGAGLMGFPEALGIIFGANVGTTITGWLVALLGFKLKLGTLVMPLIFIGAIMRLFANSRIATMGYAIAGFGLIFVGITVMQEAMAGLQNIITPESLPDNTLAGKFKLIVLGITATIITQSSSAGVAAALTALYAGAINFEQAAALVIGMDIGTTVTAAIATIGGSAGARRTGLSHVIYNLFTGCGAILLIAPYVLAWEAIAPGQITNNAEIALVGFHTTFNTLGVLLVLPFTYRFARFMEKLVPESEPAYTRHLDEAILPQPNLALTAVQSAIRVELLDILAHLTSILGDENKGKRTDFRNLQFALDETHAYLDRIHLSTGDGADWERLIALIHTLDHMQRLHERCEEEEDRAINAKSNDVLAEQCQLLVHTIDEIVDTIDHHRWTVAAKIANSAETQIRDRVESYRKITLSRIGRGEINVAEGTNHVESIRWLRRVSRHIARITEHYGKSVLATGK